MDQKWTRALFVLALIVVLAVGVRAFAKDQQASNDRYVSCVDAGRTDCQPGR